MKKKKFPSKNKAQEMLDNPPKNQPMTDKQVHFFQALAHGWTPDKEFGGSIENLPIAKSGIHINPKNKGKFNALKKKTGKTTEELTHSKNPLTRKRAIFAQNASHWNHKDDGGEIVPKVKSPKIDSYISPYTSDYSPSRDFGVSFMHPKSPLSLNTGVWSSPEENVFNKPTLSPYIGASYNIGNHNIGVTGMPGYIGANYSLTFENGGLMDDYCPECEEAKHGGFMGIHPSHKGWCTPLSNPHCTGHRRALALTLKKHHGFHKKEDGGFQDYSWSPSIAENGEIVLPNQEHYPWNYQSNFNNIPITNQPIKWQMPKYQTRQNPNITPSLNNPKAQTPKNNPFNWQAPLNTAINTFNYQPLPTNLLGSKHFDMANRNFQKSMQQAVEAGKSIVNGFTGGAGNMMGGSMPKMGGTQESNPTAPQITDNMTPINLNQGNEMHYDWTPKFKYGGLPKMPGGGFMSWGDAIAHGASSLGYLGAGAMENLAGTLDVIGNQNINRQMKSYESDLRRQSLLSQELNPVPNELYGYSNQGRNNALSYADGGFTIRDIGGQGDPNIEIEGGENVTLPNGFSQNVQGNSHAQGGIKLNLQPGSKVFSEKLKEPESGKSYSKLAKKLETKKDFDNIDSKYSDYIDKNTAEMNINLKNQKLNELFLTQESNKLSGEHGESVKNKAMEDYQMKFGGLTKYPQGGEWMGQRFSTQEGRVTPTGVDLNKDPLLNWEMYRAQWEKLAQEAGQIKKGERFKNPKDLQEFAYDWALDNNPELIKNMWRTFGVTNKDEGKYKNKDINNLNLQDLKDLRGNFIDNLKGKRMFSPVNQTQAVINQPIGQDSIKSDEVAAKNLSATKQGFDFNKLGRLPSLNVVIPDTYPRDPIWTKNLTPEYIHPKYLDIQPELNDINRQYNALSSNLGSRGGSDIANLLQAQTNAYNAKNRLYGQKYNYDQQQDSQADQFNARAKMDTDIRNLEQFNRFGDAILRREAAITEQKNIDQNARFQRLLDEDTYYNRKNEISDMFSPSLHSNAPAITDNMRWLNSLSDQDYDKLTKRWKDLSGTTYTATDNRKFGGKIKIKPKIKKK